MEDESCHAHVALYSRIVRVIAAMSREIECDAAKWNVSARLRTCEHMRLMRQAPTHLSPCPPALMARL